MASQKRYSVQFNQAKGFWIAQVKKDDGKWFSKYVPKDVSSKNGVAERVKVEQWLRGYVEAFDLGGTDAGKVAVKAMTLADIAPLWLERRYKDVSCARNTYKSQKGDLTNWILCSHHPHHKIDHLPIADLNPMELGAWVESLNGNAAGKMHKILTLRAVIKDAIDIGWIDTAANPLESAFVRKEVEKLKNEREAAKVIVALDPAQVAVLLTKQNDISHIPDIRRIRYLMSICAGLRDRESLGLMWSDLDMVAGTIDISRQLIKQGATPPVFETDLSKRKISRDDMWLVPNAVVSYPKSLQSKRLIPMHPLLKAALRYWWRKGWQASVGRAPTAADPVFARAKAANFNSGNAGDFVTQNSAVLIKADFARVGLPATYRGKAYDFHTLRRTFANLLDLQNVPMEPIGQMMGHSAKHITRQNYVQRNLSVFADYVAKMELPNYISLRNELIRVDD